MSLSSPFGKYITIATDISCDAKYKVATWACWIRYDGGVIRRSGVFSQYPNDTCRAETYALINALTIAKNNISDWGESRIIIHNEIERVLTPLLTKNGKPSTKEADRTEAIVNLAMPILDSAQSWERRKIKAHFKDWKDSDNPAKYAINRWCDIEARRLMRETRKGVKKSLKRLC
jgi:ribonuclease HI